MGNSKKNSIFFLNICVIREESRNYMTKPKLAYGI